MKASRTSFFGFIVLWLAGCSALSTGVGERDYFPGGTPYYSFGTSQSKENFVNVARAQDSLGMFRKEVYWSNIRPGVVAPSSINMLSAYLPLHVRWELKDGRQFVANIDVRAVMRDYFRSHDIRMPWQLEGRPRDKSGDLVASLVDEVKDDEVILKWLIITNHTPVSERFTSSGAANRWRFTQEEFIVTAIKGTPTRGINFDKTTEIIR